MDIVNLIMIAVGLSMDAFAVSICKGLSVQKLRPKHYILIGAWFGGFQALMPTVGYLLGKKLEEYIQKYDHWVAFALLCLIGANMIRESFSKEEESVDASFSFKAMLVLAFATSVDALAVGISFVTVIPNIPVYIASPCIGAITFGLSALGLKVGNLFGTRFKNKAELAGGIILCLIGIEILLEHLGVLSAIFG